MADSDQHQEPTRQTPPQPMGAPDRLSASGDITRSPIFLGALGVIVICAIVGAYFLGKGHHGHGATMGTGERSQAELSARSLCEATLDRVHDFGVLPPDAALASSDASETETKGRFICSAKAGDTTYKMIVDQHCSDMGDAKCLQIFNITDAAGTVLFQHREFADPDE